MQITNFVLSIFIDLFLLIEKVISGKVSGEGIKKTPAYETPLMKAELEKWRKEFWGMYKL